jgi:hypothetical protein
MLFNIATPRIFIKKIHDRSVDKTDGHSQSNHSEADNSDSECIIVFLHCVILNQFLAAF